MNNELIEYLKTIGCNDIVTIDDIIYDDNIWNIKYICNKESEYGICVVNLLKDNFYEYSNKKMVEKIETLL